MKKHIFSGLILFGLLTVITGLVYPLLITLVAQLVFPSQANGSLIMVQGEVRGSRLIGQSFTAPRYFWGRLSATGGLPYDASNSSGSNLSALNPDLQKQVKDRLAALKSADPSNTLPVPVDLVTASASGLDPDISIAAAQYQAARVARLRGLPLERVEAMIDLHSEDRTLGVLGEPRVNVLELNLDLDALQ